MYDIIINPYFNIRAINLKENNRHIDLKCAY